MAEPDSKPTIVLVHGAFADASGWSSVIQRLSALGYTAYAPANPLRGVISDGDSVRSFVATIEGPVVLVGHSYGGSVITNASAGAPNVRALVYIAAYVPDEGETLGAAGALDGASNSLPEHLLVRPYPGAPEGDGDGYIDPEYFHELFCADLPAEQAAVMAVSQRPVALSCLGTPSGPAGWKTIPSWYLVASNDNAIPPVAERAMAARAGAHTVEISSSHVAFISHVDETVELILAAVEGT
ncbi:alpha/beta hydrolase [Angustibacter luteus]|uniref:Alpha/beta hydrolase n=1 Tax=Angustibacter luteus TaxID=658456 RepID=A0ABW1JBI8_9ACTN